MSVREIKVLLVMLMLTVWFVGEAEMSVGEAEVRGLVLLMRLRCLLVRLRSRL